MPNINLTPIIQALLALLAALITYRLIPWIKERTTEAQQGNIRAAVKVLVFAAEQLYGAGTGAEKLKYVRDRLREQGYDVDTDEIEAAVAEYINHGLSFTETIDAEEEIDDDYELAPLEDWPLEMIVDFCRDNGIPCEGCQTKDEYIRAITQGGKHDPPDAAEEPVAYHTKGPNVNMAQVIEDDAEEPESTPEAEG